MKRNILLLIPCLMVFLTGFMSCAEDTEVVDPYADWQARNEHYLDSIVSVARANVDGNWEIYRNWKVNNDNSSLTYPYETPANETDSVYMRIIEPADPDGITPLYTDSVYAYHRGSLINGTVFDSCYEGELNTEIHSPITFTLNGVINGWTTALQQMKEGERVMLYIPSDLGYGDNGNSDGGIPGHSVLIFDLKLEKVVHPIGPDDRSRATDTEEQQENE